MLAAITAGLALLALIAPLAGAEVSRSARRVAAGVRRGDRDAARPAALDAAGAPAGRRERANQPAHRVSANQRVFHLLPALDLVALLFAVDIVRYGIKAIRAERA